jgi:hypothetical protein
MPRNPFIGAARVKPGDFVLLHTRLCVSRLFRVSNQPWQEVHMTGFTVSDCMLFESEIWVSLLSTRFRTIKSEHSSHDH